MRYAQILVACMVNLLLFGCYRTEHVVFPLEGGAETPLVASTLMCALEPGKEHDRSPYRVTKTRSDLGFLYQFTGKDFDLRVAFTEVGEISVRTNVSSRPRIHIPIFAAAFRLGSQTEGQTIELVVLSETSVWRLEHTQDVREYIAAQAKVELVKVDEAIGTADDTDYFIRKLAATRDDASLVNICVADMRK